MVNPWAGGEPLLIGIIMTFSEISGKFHNGKYTQTTELYALRA